MSVCVKEGRRVTCCSEGGRGGTCPVIQKAEVELDHVPSQLGIGGGGSLITHHYSASVGEVVPYFLALAEASPGNIRHWTSYGFIA